MSAISRALPEQKINIDTPQPISSDKQPPQVSNASFYGNPMVGGSQADSLLVVKKMVTLALSEHTDGKSASATSPANTADLAATVGMASYYGSYPPKL